jgi:hypothetical protein
MSPYFVRNNVFNVRNYKIIPRAENVWFCLTIKFNKNEMNFVMQFFKSVEKQTLIIAIAAYNLYIWSPEQ